MDTYRSRRAFWVHGGDPTKPHVILTSEKHSDGFFNSRLVMQDSQLADEAASDLAELLKKEGLDLNTVDRVVGPAMGAVTLAHDISRHIGLLRGRSCLSGCAEKVGEGASKRMMFKQFTPQPGERLLFSEDVTSTGESVELMSTPAKEAGAIVLPFAPLLVNRSGLKDIRGKNIVALINYPMPMWEPAECALCAQGSKAVRPKDIWDQFS